MRPFLWICLLAKACEYYMKSFRQYLFQRNTHTKSNPDHGLQKTIRAGHLVQVRIPQIASTTFFACLASGRSERQFAPGIEESCGLSPTWPLR